MNEFAIVDVQVRRRLQARVGVYCGNVIIGGHL